MSSMKNSVMLVGRPGADAEVKTAGNNQKVARFRLAVTEGRKNANSEWVENTQWFQIVGFGVMAERVEKYVKKGCQVALEGRLQNNEWTDQNGLRHVTTEIWLSDIFVVEIGRKGTSND